ncbi:Hypothetical protein NTJ_11005 [Nesidiocoris tenuis]|uniref:Uncharacterized protein n=1 Tax=Nesidiocoris tenuis TaxID=355587 RepID=A0ABN7B3L3_9HEMI|nr:Hypothetical protein NTJ_11005 [Nesidiocoris tenuis]
MRAKIRKFGWFLTKALEGTDQSGNYAKPPIFINYLSSSFLLTPASTSPALSSTPVHVDVLSLACLRSLLDFLLLYVINILPVMWPSAILEAKPPSPLALASPNTRWQPNRTLLRAGRLA